ncbi:hypothetical protein EX30DRAFT_374973 [Ascodesmis nigricans]|uniref:Uncharacterized protein n=1 Tax=Ascodesmis nigricans TaxID=341454 RepID=A0A4S2MJT2_9PEZI|nr:hypothetical protein EX30DRAFT_374973 [Ascodesmis nigricans]
MCLPPRDMLVVRKTDHGTIIKTVSTRNPSTRRPRNTYSWFRNYDDDKPYRPKSHRRSSSHSIHYPSKSSAYHTSTYPAPSYHVPGMYPEITPPPPPQEIYGMQNCLLLDAPPPHRIPSSSYMTYDRDIVDAGPIGPRDSYITVPPPPPYPVPHAPRAPTVSYYDDGRDRDRRRHSDYSENEYRGSARVRVPIPRKVRMGGMQSGVRYVQSRGEGVEGVEDDGGYVGEREYRSVRYRR